jgi:hypothetical protein
VKVTSTGATNFPVGTVNVARGFWAFTDRINAEKVKNESNFFI